METVNQVQTEATNTEGAAKTFTQEDVNKIVEERLQRERQKYAGMADYDQLKEKAGKYDELQEASKTELQKATDRAEKLQKELNDIKHAESVRTIRSKVAEEKGVPANLLTADTEEACTEQADAILAFANPSGYPNVRDGGETNVTGKKSTSDLFGDWFNKNFGG